MPEDIDAMRAAQNGLCPICERVLEKFHVDHCHETGRIRGLLCPDCNRGIGGLKDSRKIVLRAAAYLRRHGYN